MARPPLPPVYIIETADDDQLPDEGAEDLCSLCSRGHCPENMIECSRCLGGFHMKCMKPALKAVPEVGFVCVWGGGGTASHTSRLRPPPKEVPQVRMHEVWTYLYPCTDSRQSRLRSTLGSTL